MGRLAGLILLGVWLALPGPARAQLDSREAIQLQNQLLELRRDVQALREQVRGMGSSGSALSFGRSSGSAPSGFAPSGSAPSGGGEITAALLERVGQLEEQVRRLQGKLDEVDNARQRQSDELKKDLEDLNFKLGSGAGAAGATRPTPPSAGGSTPPAAGGATTRRTPEVAMQEGNAALARRDYVTAESAAREVLTFPRSPRAVDAQFLLAQTLVGKRDYQGAAIAFDDTYNRSKTGTHAQPALVGLANALTAINEKRAACATMDKLKVEFPNPRADLKDAITAARQRAGCR